MSAVVLPLVPGAGSEGRSAQVVRRASEELAPALQAAVLARQTVARARDLAVALEGFRAALNLVAGLLADGRTRLPVFARAGRRAAVPARCQSRPA